MEKVEKRKLWGDTFPATRCSETQTNFAWKAARKELQKKLFLSIRRSFYAHTDATKYNSF
jgi:hypothetical protein